MRVTINVIFMHLMILLLFPPHAKFVCSLAGPRCVHLKAEVEGATVYNQINLLLVLIRRQRLISQLNLKNGNTSPRLRLGL